MGLATLLGTLASGCSGPAFEAATGFAEGEVAGGSAHTGGSSSESMGGQPGGLAEAPNHGDEADISETAGASGSSPVATVPLPTETGRNNHPLGAGDAGAEPSEQALPEHEKDDATGDGGSRAEGGQGPADSGKLKPSKKNRPDSDRRTDAGIWSHGGNP